MKVELTNQRSFKLVPENKAEEILIDMWDGNEFEISTMRPGGGEIFAEVYTRDNLQKDGKENDE